MPIFRHLKQSRSRRVAAASAGIFALATGGLLVAPAVPASSSTVGIICAVGSQTATYSPALTNDSKPTHVHITENYDCTSPLTGVSSASGSADIFEDASCLITAQPGLTDIVTYQWNTGQSSIVTYSVTNVVRAANGTTTVTSVGAVTSGLGQGSTATRIVVLPALSLTACSTTGLAAQTGVAELNIAP